MQAGSSHQSEYQAAIRSWERRTPLYRRVSARLGLQGKLVLSFVLLLIGALGGSCWLLLRESGAILDHVSAEHAEQMCRAVGMASRTPLEHNNVAELNRIGQALLKHQEMQAVAFFAPSGDLLTAASRTPKPSDDASAALFSDPTEQPWLLGQPSFKVRQGMGRCVTVTAPVLNAAAVARGTHAEGVRIVGYVMVCLSQTDTQWAVREAAVSLVSLNATVLLLSLPLVLALVHRIFSPIRELAFATQRIAAGDLETQVAIHRPDAIGALARSFNDMVRQVRAHRQQLTEANEKLAQANQELETKVRQRTAELVATNKQLSTEIADKEEFLRAVSHDLGAPLRNIAGMASMLLLKSRAALDDEMIHRLERIQKNVEVENSLLAELLELSQIKSRRERIEIVAIEQLVRDVAGIFEEDLRARAIRMTIDNRLPSLRCERNRMRQVFQNLIDNAIKYMGDGSRATPDGDGPALKEIHVGCRSVPGHVEFYVRDTGIGIAPADIGKVFQVFRRGSEAAVRNIPGKGVGLASVKSIIETYEGQIRVESRVGQGTLFRFTIHGRFVVAGEASETNALPPMEGRFTRKEPAASR